MITYSGNINLNGVLTNARINLDLSEYERKLQKAQYWLDNQIFNDMEPYMPYKTGTLKQLARAETSSLAGTGKVVAAAGPYGRFQYEGKVMVDPNTGSPWARPKAKKVLTERPLAYANPLTEPHWFETAKKNHLKGWIEGVEKVLNG